MACLRMKKLKEPVDVKRKGLVDELKIGVIEERGDECSGL